MIQMVSPGIKAGRQRKTVEEDIQPAEVSCWIVGDFQWGVVGLLCSLLA